eukprot:symbB.v1.2.000429.t1/scaffold32.1/size405148/2
MTTLVPLLIAASGGFLWAFGVLGKRVGVEGATNANRGVRAAITIFVYTLTTAITPLFNVWRLGLEGWQRTWNTPEWSSRLPLLMICGVISGIGGLLGTIAFAWAAGSSSGLISMIENGTYTMMSAILIALYFHEHPKTQAYIGFVLIMLGVVLAQKSSTQRMEHVRQDESDNEAEAEASESSGPVTASHGSNGLDNSGSAADNVSIQMSERSKEDGVSKQSVSIAVSAELQRTSSMATSSSDCDDSMVAPTRFRFKAVALAVVAGTCWGFGPLGKKIGVHGSSKDQKEEWAACTYFVYMLSTCVVPLLRVMLSDATERRESLKDKSFRWLLLGTMLCGIISGVGGMLSTYAFAQENEGYSGALISTVENGIYTVFGAVLITVVFKERLSGQQMGSALCVTLAIVIFGLDFHSLEKLFGK